MAGLLEGKNIVVMGVASTKEALHGGLPNRLPGKGPT